MEQSTPTDPSSPHSAQAAQLEGGEALKFIRVRFPGHTHSYPFLLGHRRLVYGQKVVALSDRGMAVGYVNSFPYEVPYSEKLNPIRTISKIATTEDELNAGTQDGQEREMEESCKGLIKKHQLEMNLTHVELTGYGKKVVFYFTAPQRVDFRGLVRDLVSALKIRVELRQISARERAAALGGLGPCGQSLCCSTFLKQYGNVSIKMAKVQNLTLVPSKLNGLCGQLKCCLAYEEEVYQEKRGRLPKEGQLIATANGDRGKVLRLHPLAEQFDLLTEQGVIRRYHWQQYHPQQYPLPTEWSLPKNFPHISHETSEIIGLATEDPSPSSAFPEYPLGESKPIPLATPKDRPPSSPPTRPTNHEAEPKAQKNDPFKGSRHRRPKKPRS